MKHENSLRRPSLGWPTRAVCVLAMMLLLPASFFQQEARATSPATPLQNQVGDAGRANPAPWRPSFGTVDRGAASQVANEASSTNGYPSPYRDPNQPMQGYGNPSGVNNAADNTPRLASASALPRERSNTGPTAPGITRVTRSLDKLPNDAGQVWREYDITPYTSRLPESAKPQQAILDWILKETGSQMWFNEPLGVLSADRKRVVVYHTPEIHRVVKSIVDRFTRTRAQSQLFDINLVTVGNPSWRTNAYTMLQPIEVRSPNIEAWLVSKENAAILLGQLANRGDFRQHSGGRAVSPDGQTMALQNTKPVPFVRSIKWTPNEILGYQPVNTTIDEGYSLAISCLTSLDNQSIEAIIKCDVDQVEKLTPVKVNVPQAGGRVNQLDLNIPQLVSWRLHERFRWPSDQVLILSCGIVASPESDASGNRAGASLPRLPFLSPKTSRRADALLFLEYRGPESEATVARTAGGGNSFAPVERPR